MVSPSWDSFQRPNIQNQTPPQKEIRQAKKPILEKEVPILPIQQIPNEQQELNEEIPGDFQDAQSPEGEKPQWGNFQTPETYQGEPDPTKDESALGYITRNITSNASRLGEQILGRVGNLEKFGTDVLSSLPQAGGILGWAISELVGPEKWEKMVKGKGPVFPTSEEIKEFSQSASKGYTKPKTKGEEKFQGFTEDVGSMIGPGRAPTARNIAINNLGIPAAANAVKEVVNGLGFGESKADVAKLGAWTALSLMGNVNAPQYASELMNRGRNGIPNTVNIDVPRLQNRLMQVSNSNFLLHSDPRSSLARQQLDGITKDLQNGQTSVRSMMNAYDGINAAKRNRGLFELNRSDQNFARRAIDEVRNAVRDEIMESSKRFPNAMRDWRGGIQAWAVIHQSRAMTNWVDNLAKGPYSKILQGPAAALFGVTTYGGIKSPIVALPASVGIPAAYKTAQTAYRVWQDPNLSQYYWRAILEAQRENSPAFINNYEKLNKKLKEKDKKS